MSEKNKELQALLDQDKRNLTVCGCERIKELKRELNTSDQSES